MSLTFSASDELIMRRKIDAMFPPYYQFRNMVLFIRIPFWGMKRNGKRNHGYNITRFLSPVSVFVIVFGDP